MKSFFIRLWTSLHKAGSCRKDAGDRSQLNSKKHRPYYEAGQQLVIVNDNFYSYCWTAHFYYIKNRVEAERSCYLNFQNVFIVCIAINNPSMSRMKYTERCLQ